jgi:hypothetical protein
MCVLRQKRVATPQKKCSNWVYIILFFLYFELNGMVFKKVIFYNSFSILAHGPVNDEDTSVFFKKNLYTLIALKLKNNHFLYTHF